MRREQREVRDLREGEYVLIDDEPCEITHYTTAAPGKHGSAKARIEGRGVFDDKKRSLNQPVDQTVWVPVIERKQAQVVHVEGDEVQVMDLDTYDTFRMKAPDEDLAPDDTIEFLEYEDERRFL